MLYGIDISNWQKDLDASKVNADFCIMKATEGIGYVNPSCDKHYQQAKQAGKRLGVYHFAQPGDAKTQAKYFVDNVRNYVGEAVLVLDWESRAQAQGPHWAWDWLAAVQAMTGVYPLIYMSQSVTLNKGWETVAKHCGLWVAQYPSNAVINGYKDLGFSKSVGVFKSPAIWQYTSNGRIQGYSGTLDCDAAYMSREAWGKYADPGINILKPEKNNTSVLENEEYTVTIKQKE